jgi:hypothetical protein
MNISWIRCIDGITEVMVKGAEESIHFSGNKNLTLQEDGPKTERGYYLSDLDKGTRSKVADVEGNPV